MLWESCSRFKDEQFLHSMSVSIMYSLGLIYIYKLTMSISTKLSKIDTAMLWESCSES